LGCLGVLRGGALCEDSLCWYTYRIRFSLGRPQRLWSRRSGNSALPGRQCDGQPGSTWVLVSDDQLRYWDRRARTILFVHASHRVVGITRYAAVGERTYGHDNDSLLPPMSDVPPQVHPCIDNRRLSVSRLRSFLTACLIFDPVSQLGPVWIVK
jgi:hypothetical protein